MRIEEQIEIEANKYAHLGQREAFVKGAMRGYSLAIQQFDRMLYEKEKLRVSQEIILKTNDELLNSL